MIGFVNGRHATLAEFLHNAIWADVFTFSEGHTLTPTGVFFSL
jgi:hypothetical protein